MKQNAFILVVLLLSAWVCGCSDGDLDSGAPNGVLDPFARADLGRLDAALPLDTIIPVDDAAAPIEDAMNPPPATDASIMEVPDMMPVPDADPLPEDRT